MGVFTGSDLLNLTRVDVLQTTRGLPQNGMQVFFGQSSFTAIAGENYSVLVDTLSGPGTEFELVIDALPLIEIVMPTDGSDFSPGSDILFNSEAFDPDGAITQVSYFKSSKGVALPGVATNSPYTVTLTNAAPGAYEIVAKALDDLSMQGSSPIIQFTVAGATNDHFINRALLEGVSVLANGDNRISTRQQKDNQPH